MNKATREAGAKLLEKAPGPSPWYVGAWPRPGGSAGLAWSRFGESGSVKGETRAGRSLFIVPMYTRLLGVAEGEVTFLRLGERTAQAATYRFTKETPRVEPGAAMEADKQPPKTGLIVTTAEVVARIEIPMGQEAGTYAAPKVKVASLGEEVGWPGTGPTATGEGTRAAVSLYLWRPREGQLMVTPLEWFNSETADLGYEWFTRCAREPRSGLVFADGIRVGAVAVDGRGERL